MLERVLDAFRPAAEDGGRRLESDIEPAIQVQGDVVLLGQLVSNLVENAITHTSPGARIGVVARRDGGQAVVTIADDGPGVPEDERGRITRRFYRLDRSRSTPGDGLGLSMVAAIADLHGAALAFSGNDPGLKVELRFGWAA